MMKKLSKKTKQLTKQQTKKTPARALWEPEVLELARNVGRFIEYWGFKRIQGEIWTLIFLSKTPVDATSLVQGLSVSKALVSLAIKDLLAYNVIETAGRGGKRTIFFRSTSDLQGVITQVLQRREKILLEETKLSIEKIGRKSLETSLSEERLLELTDLVWAAQDFLEVLIHTKLEPSKSSKN